MCIEPFDWFSSAFMKLQTDHSLISRHFDSEEMECRIRSSSCNSRLANSKVYKWHLDDPECHRYRKHDYYDEQAEVQSGAVQVFVRNASGKWIVTLKRPKKFNFQHPFRLPL